MNRPSAPRESLTSILAIQERATGGHGARLESFWGGSLPGDLVARAILAAGAEVSRVPAAVHALFYAPVHPEVELLLECDALSEERVGVRVWREGDRLADVALRYGPGGDGLTYQCVRPEPALPAPDDLPSELELARAEGWAEYATGPIEARRIGSMQPVKDDEPAVWQGWLKPREALPDDPLVHAAALAFLAEYRSHWAVERRLGPAFSHTEITLLDHTLWVHRYERWDDWWLVRTRSEVGVGGRCLGRREIYRRDGVLVATAVWEAIARSRSPGG